jgi:methyl-accepting chemotaxis protein
MKKINDLKIGTKLIVSYLLISLIMLVVGIQGFKGMQTINDMLERMYTNELMGLSHIKEANIDLIYIGRAQSNYLLAASPADRAYQTRRMAEYETHMLAELEAAKPLIHTEKGKANLAEIYREWADYQKIAGQVLAMSKDDQHETSKQTVTLAQTVARPQMDRVDTVFTHLARTKEMVSRQAFEESNDIYHDNILYMAIMIIGGIGMAIGVGVFIARLITRPIKQVADRIEQLKNLCVSNLGKGLDALATGDAGYTVVTGTELLKMDAKDEIGDLSRSIDGIILQTRSSVDSFERSRGILKGVVAEIDTLVRSAKEGDLGRRGSAEHYKGTYKELITGINDTIAAFVTPMQESAEVLKVMSSGDLTVRVRGEYKGDFLLIKDSVNQLGESFDRALGNVAEAVSATASASSEISSSTEQMAAGSEEQTQQAAEVAGAVEQMSKTILETTRNAGEAASIAKQAGAKALEGGEIIKQTIEGMNRIAEVVTTSATTVQALGQSSDQIGEIVQVIDDIADQTNLLALNAAIEAARAGEQGRGFAVVADEVRKLAERTTKATKEIAKMIKQIQKDTAEAVSSMNKGKEQVEAGKLMADRSGASLKEIIIGAEQVVGVVLQVAAASEEQSSASEQISKNIEAISSVTHESAAGTQQIARAAEDLNRLTTNLQELLTQFTVSDKVQVVSSQPAHAGRALASARW